MKLSILNLLLLSAALDFTSAGSSDDSFDAEECRDCLDDLEDARACLRICNDRDFISEDGTNEGSLLAFCLDESRSSDVEDVDDLIECCGFEDDDCEDDLEDVAECIPNCIDGCLVDTSEDYLECIVEETGRSGCSLEECLDTFLGDDVEDELDELVEDELSASVDLDLDSFSASESIDLDLEELEETISGFSSDDVEDCALLEDFIDDVCELGDDCCDDCQEELAVVLDCVINDVVITFLSLSLNRSIAECPIDTEECELDARKVRNRKRELSDELLAKSLALPSSKSKKDSRRAAKREILIQKMMAPQHRRTEEVNTTALVSECESAFHTDIISYNISFATETYMECIGAAAIGLLESGDEEPGDGSGGFAVFAGKMGAALIALVGSMLVFA